MTSEVLPELWSRCDPVIMKGCRAWLGRARLQEVEGVDEDEVEVDVEAKKVRVQLNQLCLY
jgi:hypothetical protein